MAEAQHFLNVCWFTLVDLNQFSASWWSFSAKLHNVTIRHSYGDSVPFYTDVFTLQQVARGDISRYGWRVHREIPIVRDKRECRQGTSSSRSATNFPPGTRLSQRLPPIGQRGDFCHAPTETETLPKVRDFWPWQAHWDV